MRLIVVFSVLLLFDLYVFQAFRLWTGGWSFGGRMIIYVLFWVVTLFAILFLGGASTALAEVLPKGVFTILRAFLLIVYFSKLLVASMLLLDDLRRLGMWTCHQFAGESYPNIGRSRFLTQFGLLLGSLPFFTLLYGIIRNPYRYKLYQEEVEIEDLPKDLDGLKIVQISDIHSGSFTFKEPVKRAIDMINRERPDLVFFTGDLVNSTADEMEDYVDVFREIKARYGVFSVTGNHDYGDYVRWPSMEARKHNFEKFKNLHKRMGWRLLLNEHEWVKVGKEKLAVIGVENYSALPHFRKYGNLKKAYAGTEEAGLKILLSHDPTHWEAEVTRVFKDIAVTFSGHTHGFQFGIEIPGWLKWSPGKYIYKQWAGLYQIGKQFLYVNRGLGFLGYPGRVGILPEITLLVLKRKAK